VNLGFSLPTFWWNWYCPGPAEMVLLGLNLSRNPNLIIISFTNNFWTDLHSGIYQVYHLLIYNSSTIYKASHPVYSNNLSSFSHSFIFFILLNFYNWNLKHYLKIDLIIISPSSLSKFSLSFTRLICLNDEFKLLFFGIFLN